MRYVTLFFMRKSNATGLIDTHSHMFWDLYKDDFEEVIQKAVNAGVTTLVNVGVDVEISKKALELTTLNPEMRFYSSIGIHPHEAYKYSDKLHGTSDNLQKDIEELEEIYRQNPQKVVGVGECGLDSLFNAKYAPNGESSEELMVLQKKLFKAQIDLAKKLDLPLLIHCRDDRGKNPMNTECWDEVLEMTSDHYGILHCYSGLLSTTKKALDSKFLFSFAGNLTYPKNEYLREAVKIIPLDRIVLETDCPFLPPQSIRGQRNEPSSVREIAEMVAEIKKASFEEVARVSTENAVQVFKLQR